MGVNRYTNNMSLYGPAAPRKALWLICWPQTAVTWHVSLTHGDGSIEPQLILQRMRHPHRIHEQAGLHELGLSVEREGVHPHIPVIGG